MNQIGIVPVNEAASNAVHTASPVVVPVVADALTLRPALDDVHGIIARVVSSARASGRDYVDQCRSAAEAVVAVRPDLSMPDVLTAIFRMREQDMCPVLTLNAA